MKRVLCAVAAALLVDAAAAAQPTPGGDSPSTEVRESIRGWIAEQRVALRNLEPKLGEAEAAYRQFRDYLRRMRTDAAAQRAILALGELRPFELERAERNWVAWRAIAQAQVEAVERLAVSVAERKLDQEERWQLLDDGVAADLVPQASEAFEQAQAWKKETASLVARFEALLLRTRTDAESAVALCDDILALLVRSRDRLRSRFLLDRTTLESIARAGEDLPKDAAALLEPVEAAWRDTSFGDALRRNAAALITAALLLGLAAWRVRRWANGLETAADTLGERRFGLLARVLACGLIALSRTLGLALAVLAGAVIDVTLGGEAPAWREGFVRLLREIFLWRLAVAFVRVAFPPGPTAQRLFEAGDADLARSRLERVFLWLFVGQLQATLLGYVGLLSAPVMLGFVILLLFGVGSIVRSLGDDRTEALGLSGSWAVAARQWRAFMGLLVIVGLAAAGVGFINVAWLIALSQLRATGMVLTALLIWCAGADGIERWSSPLEARARSHVQVVWAVVMVVIAALALPSALGVGTPVLQAVNAGIGWSFEIGGQTISVGRVLAAVFWVFLAWALSRVINLALTRRIFPHASVDAGMRQAITATIGYLLIAVGALLAIRALGFDLTNLAIVAGALSVGVGFGMQNLVSNFVSGLIILYERPFRPGDILDYEGTMGTVKRIQTRSTIVQTFDESELVLPNSELLAKRITNWTLSNYRARAIISVGVAYGSDVDLVRETLLDAAAAHPRLADEPKVYFHAFGDSALEFRLMVWLDIREKLQVVSDLHFAIDRAFRDKGIAIPFPQRELRVHAVGG